MEDIKDIQEILTALDNTTKEQLDKAIKNVDKEWSEMEMEEEINELEIKILETKESAFPTYWTKEDADLVAKIVNNLLKRNNELEKENQSYRDYFGTPPCYDNANYIPKSKVKEVRNKFDKMVKEMYAEKKEITDHDVFILFDKLLEGDK